MLASTDTKPSTLVVQSENFISTFQITLSGDGSGEPERHRGLAPRQGLCHRPTSERVDGAYVTRRSSFFRIEPTFHSVDARSHVALQSTYIDLNLRQVFGRVIELGLNGLQSLEEQFVVRCHLAWVLHLL